MSVRTSQSSSTAGLRGRVVGLYAALIGANVAAWAWAVAVLHDTPALLGAAALAYAFGLRHAVDADHIAAIDNVTRKLMQAGGGRSASGLWFSLGHAAVVAACRRRSRSRRRRRRRRLGAKAVGGVVGTCASALFLFAIAFVNMVVLISVWRALRAVKRGEPFVETDFDLLLNSRGLLSRLFRPLFGLVTRSWHMLVVGFVFGLGFDTASEIALFGISATQAGGGASFATVMVFPALFAAAMALVDTTDGMLMLGAYGWAFLNPIRKLYYNLVVTAASVVVAVAVGGLETLGLVSRQLGLAGFWSALDDDFALLGYLIVGGFVALWLGSVAVYRLMRDDEIEAPAR